MSAPKPLPPATLKEAAEQLMSSITLGASDSVVTAEMQNLLTTMGDDTDLLTIPKDQQIVYVMCRLINELTKVAL